MIVVLVNIWLELFIHKLDAKSSQVKSKSLIDFHRLWIK